MDFANNYSVWSVRFDVINAASRIAICSILRTGGSYKLTNLSIFFPKCKWMKSTKSKTAKTPSVKHSQTTEETGPSFVEASADSDASPENVPPAIPAEDSTPVSEITKAMLSKVRRAFRKAGKEAAEAEQAKFAEELIAAGIPILSRSSNRIAKVLKGKETLEDLKISKSRKTKTT
jgi:hypothetical protein